MEMCVQHLPVPRMGSIQESTQRQLAIRRLIVAVAKHKFARVGYEGASLDDIRHAADVTWEDLLAHFESKATLLKAVLHEGWKNLGPRLADIAFSSENARLSMLALLGLMSNVLQQDEDWMRLMLFEGRSPDPESGEICVSDGYGKFLHLCTELVVRGQKEGTFRTEYHPEVVSSMLVGAIEGIMRDRLRAEQRSGFTPYSGTYLMAVFDALVSYLGPEAR